MNFLNFKNGLSPYLVFSLSDIFKIYPDFKNLQLNRWQKKGYLKKIIKGFYIFTDQEINEEILFLIANKIYAPSYISNEMALRHYNLIPENVYQITSVTTNKTYRLTSESTDFNYRKIRNDLFWGYRLVKYQNQSFKIAEPEKALLDFFYLNSHLKSKEDFLGLRLNKEVFQEIIDLEKFRKYLANYRNQALLKRMNLFLTLFI